MALTITPIAPSPTIDDASKTRARTDSTPSEEARPTSDANADAAAAAAAVEDQSQAVISAGRTVEFSFDDEAQRVVIKVKSADDGEVVRQIPPEEYLKFIAQFKEMVGVLFDETA